MRQQITMFAVVLLASLGEAATAHAQNAGSADNTAAVEAVFADGKRLMQEGKTAEACPKFLASYNLEHRVGTLLNLAACYEKNGQVASAWGRYVEGRTLATRGNQTERAAFASERANALEPRRSFLTIVVNEPPAGLVVKRDGIVVEPAVYGVAVPVDGGSHTIEAMAPDKRPVTSTVIVGAESDRKTYAVALPAAMGSPPSVPPPSTSSSSGSTQRLVGLGVGVAGLAGLALGAGFGASASSSWSKSQNDCASPTSCLNRAQAVSEHDSATSAATVSTIGFVAGGALLAGGVILFLTAPHDQTSHVGAAVRILPSVGREGGGMLVSGSFW
jgi:hypothetical protein